MRGLTKVDADELTEDENECVICKVKFASFAGSQVASSTLTPTINDQGVAEQSVNTQEGVDVEQVIPEIPLKLACGHIIGERCIQSWISGRMGGTEPNCPICRVAIPEIRDFEVPEVAVVVSLDNLRGLVVLLGFNPYLHSAQGF